MSGYFHSLNPSIGPWPCSLFCSAFLTRCGHFADGRLSLSWFFIAHPLYSRHGDAQIHLILWPRSFLSRLNNGIHRGVRSVVTPHWQQCQGLDRCSHWEKGWPLPTHHYTFSLCPRLMFLVSISSISSVRRVTFHPNDGIIAACLPLFNNETHGSHIGERHFKDPKWLQCLLDSTAWVIYSKMILCVHVATWAHQNLDDFSSCPFALVIYTWNRCSILT